MSERDLDIDFDFFDDDRETEEATQRRRAAPPRPPRPGGAPPRRPPVQAPRGLTPVLRLILLIALAIFVVIVLVFWIQACRSESRKDAYRGYVEDVAALARASDAIARDLNQQLTTPGIKQADLVRQLEGLSDRQQQVADNAEDLDPPGPLREEHEHVIEAFQLRVSGLNGLAAAFRETAGARDAARAGTLLAAQAERLVASDVVWDDLFKDPAKAELDKQGIQGVNVPDSNAILTADLASTRSMVNLWERLHTAATGGTPTGLHGTGIVSTVVLPSGDRLTTDEENVVEATSDLAFQVTVQNTGEAQEVAIKVTLTIQKTPEPIVQTKTINLINPNETKTVVFEDLGQPPFGPVTPVKVDVAPVPGERTTTNNTAEYPVVFGLPQ